MFIRKWAAGFSVLVKSTIRPEDLRFLQKNYVHGKAGYLNFTQMNNFLKIWTNIIEYQSIKLLGWNNENP